ncbi:MAG: ABC transporter ATP-binding protein [Planctomycetota bacterium]
MSDSKDEKPILSIEGLKTVFALDEGSAVAVDRIDLHIARAETVALVGESGCGKTAAALSILRLLPVPPGKIEQGRILFKGNDLLSMPMKALRKIRGNRISMVFQEPMTSLNPVMCVGGQVAEVYRLHLGMSRAEALRAAEGMLDRVGISEPGMRMQEFPHQLSGGMKQRIMISMALACKPDLLIADEPTTAVDVTVQAQLLSLLKTCRDDFGMSILLISHDLSVVAELADRVYIMYASRIVETARTLALHRQPLHPYTAGLFRSLPGLNAGGQRLMEIPGSVPDPLCFPAGCRFHPRCDRRGRQCETEEPCLRELSEGRWVACHFPLNETETVR